MNEVENNAGNLERDGGSGNTGSAGNIQRKSDLGPHIARALKLFLPNQREAA
jgi:hypothetical protein